jgi:hypothetical protein
LRYPRSIFAMRVQGLDSFAQRSIDARIIRVPANRVQQHMVVSSTVRYRT